MIVIFYIYIFIKDCLFAKILIGENYEKQNS